MYENILKGWVTSTIGVLIMAGSAYAMIIGILDPHWDGTIVFAIGFICLFMRDNVPGWIKRIINLFLRNGTTKP